MKKRSLSALTAWWVAVIVAGCGGDGLVAPPEGDGPETPRAGGIRVLIAPETVPRIEGSTLQVDGEAYGPVTPSGVLTISPVAAGEHNVALVDLPPGCEVVGENPRSIRVQSGVLTSVRFELACEDRPL